MSLSSDPLIKKGRSDPDDQAKVSVSHQVSEQCQLAGTISLWSLATPFLTSLSVSPHYV